MKLYFKGRDAGIVFVNALDHFDKNLFAFLVPVLSVVFLGGEQISIKYSTYGYLITGIAGLAKFAGVFYFAKIADFAHPSRALTISIAGMSLTILAIGLLPAHNIIGLAAIILFVILKIASDFFAAGESVVARNYILEDKSGRALVKSSSRYHISTMIGIVAAGFASSAVYSSANQEFTWRLFFIVASLASLPVFCDRKIACSAKIFSMSIAQRYRVGDVWRYKGQLASMSIISCFSYLTYTMPFVIMPIIFSYSSDVTTAQLVGSGRWLLLFDVVMLFVASKIICRTDTARVMLLCSVVLAILIIPLWKFGHGAGGLYINFLRVVFVVVGTLYSISLSVAFRSWTQRSKHQYLIIGLASTVGSIIGGFMPAAFLYIFQKFGYIMCGVTISIFCAVAAINIIKAEKIDYSR